MGQPGLARQRPPRAAGVCLDRVGVALVAAYQGIALGANTLRDPSLVVAEGARLERWIDELAASA
jgi:TetR/AcrR family transcriptional regulator, transcriptional repressor for nem operon